MKEEQKVECRLLIIHSIHSYSYVCLYSLVNWIELRRLGSGSESETKQY